MKLRTFYVKSYRSITEATLDNIQNYGVFVGPNNAGKSNLLRAIYISLSIALEGDFQRARRNRQYSYAYRGENYNWERDIPVNLRENKGASTTFKLTFEFSDEEKADFRQKFNINLTKSLQMKFQLFSNRTEYNIIMPGRAKKPMEEKMQDIGLFIRSKLDYEYILCLMLPANLVKTCLPLRRVLVYTPHQFGHEKGVLRDTQNALNRTTQNSI